MASSPERANPTVAAVLTWILPGSGHLYAGAPVLAAVGFAVTMGLFGLGFVLSDGRTWEFLHLELRGPFATLLAPEAGNLGGWLLVKELRGYGPDYLRVFPSTMALGSMLLAASGVFNACLMASAHHVARTARETLTPVRRDPGMLAFMAFLVPGLGHFLQGRAKRAVIVALLLVGFFLLGTLLTEGANLSRERHFYYWGGQLFLGLPAMLAELAFGPGRVDHVIRLGDAGLLFASLAGLLNILAMLDVYAFADDTAFGRDPVAARQAKKNAEAKA